jgi:hyperosmotically inducible protein
MAHQFRIATVGSLLLSVALQAEAAPARPQAQSTRTPAASVAGSNGSGHGEMTMMISDEIRHRLLMLSNYGVFDWLECELLPDGSAILRGAVTRPTLKSDAESTLKKIEGISRVDDQIEVLPISPTDDQIRIAVYRAIFRYESPLFRYATQSSAPIHIIVNNGHVTLKGNIDSAADSQLAYTAANGVPGVFDVKNELKVGS